MPAAVSVAVINKLNARAVCGALESTKVNVATLEVKSAVTKDINIH